MLITMHVMFRLLSPIQTTKIAQRIPGYAANFVPANDMILDLLPRAMSQMALAVLKPFDGALSSAPELRGSLSGDPIGI